MIPTIIIYSTIICFIVVYSTLGFDGTEDEELGLLSLDDEGVVELLVVEELELFVM